MPIRAELRRQFYGPRWRKEIRPRILARAKNRCERCNVPNYHVVRRCGGGWLSVLLKFGHSPLKVWIGADGLLLGFTPKRHMIRTVLIVLQVIHLNHVRGDDRDENLAAYCQWCHLNYDQQQHKKTRSVRKDAARPLLQVAM